MEHFDEDAELPDGLTCPVCAAINAYPHWLLTVDIMCREAYSGPYFQELFELLDGNERVHDDDSYFDDLLDRLRRAADHAVEHEGQSGPLMDTVFESYFAKTDAAKDAFRRAIQIEHSTPSGASPLR